MSRLIAIAAVILIVAFVVQALRQRREFARWLDTPSGCCECGTGGPYYTGAAKPVTRYLYGDTCGGGPLRGTPDWSSCSEHPVDGIEPVVDYGMDVVVTSRQAEADYAAALSEVAR